ncbi:hypothetical protein B0H16DRAFT_1831018 [Mycena metata]|uniref:beta-ketoacyl-[acyl-carrier-protein] synthase I n=1 Tax=Mycena metata TaxID=1033252 RepID=A0AAD7E0V2_9AGAR|nr:hypothetical protein B0H16DRAFT_1831018 [Mycena metata]
MSAPKNSTAFCGRRRTFAARFFNSYLDSYHQNQKVRADGVWGQDIARGGGLRALLPGRRGRRTGVFFCERTRTRPAGLTRRKAGDTTFTQAVTVALAIALRTGARGARGHASLFFISTTRYIFLPMFRPSPFFVFCTLFLGSSPFTLANLFPAHTGLFLVSDAAARFDTCMRARLPQTLDAADAGNARNDAAEGGTRRGRERNKGQHARGLRTQARRRVALLTLVYDAAPLSPTPASPCARAAESRTAVPVRAHPQIFAAAETRARSLCFAVHQLTSPGSPRSSSPAPPPQPPRASTALKSWCSTRPSLQRPSHGVGTSNLRTLDSAGGDRPYASRVRQGWTGVLVQANADARRRGAQNLPNATSVSADKIPLLLSKRKIATSGTAFKDKNTLLTGVGKGSIGVEIIKGLLSGGAHVVITTSRYSCSTVKYYLSIFRTFGSAGSALTVVPFNQGSKQDVEALVDYIYANLGLDLDYIIPFAGVPENGREIDGLDDKSELAHRIMLVNLLRILGVVKSKKASRHFVTRPTQVILPLSPNHGLFGNDGLYSESKISLETLFQRWSSESWGEYLCLAGAVIGWTRGTGLMGPTNIVAHELESYGVRTFSSKEMAFNILGLMHPLLFSITQLPDLAAITGRIRSDLIDILQETFINTTAGWVNLLLMSSSGPVKIPGYCLAVARNCLQHDFVGQAKVMIAGGFDDLSQEGSFEFANMKATSNAESEFAMGREPTEMSRPATTTRAGFMESQGTGVHIVMSAKPALELGAPIRGILAFTSTSIDKTGRSIPAPGLGPLTIAREVPSKHPLPILDLAYRSRQLAFRRTQISQWLTHEHSQLQEELQIRKIANMEKEAAQQDRDVMLEGTDPCISPLPRTLAVWGLTADDVGVLSIHGTSTKANEENETRIWNDIFTTIARTLGNAGPIRAQKSIVGRSKGGSAAWQMAGLLRTVNTGIIPGNRNSDNIDSHFKQRQFLMFPSKSIHTDGIRAGVMSSFGFGQVGGIALIVHPRYLFATLEPSHYEAYKECHAIKETPPYSPDLEAPVLLNSLARASLDTKTGSYKYQAKLASTVSVDTANLAISESLAAAPNAASGVIGIGVDQELISAVPSSKPTHPRPRPCCALSREEVVFKSLGVKSKGAAAAVLDIEILNEATGAPAVRLQGDARKGADKQDISKASSSIPYGAGHEYTGNVNPGVAELGV